MHVGSPLLREFDRWWGGHERAEQRIEVTMGFVTQGVLVGTDG